MVVAAKKSCRLAQPSELKHSRTEAFCRAPFSQNKQRLDPDDAEEHKVVASTCRKQSPRTTPAQRHQPRQRRLRPEAY